MMIRLTENLPGSFSMIVNACKAPAANMGGRDAEKQ